MKNVIQYIWRQSLDSAFPDDAEAAGPGPCFE